MEKGEYPLSGRIREAVEAYPSDSSRVELIHLLDVLVGFLSIDTRILKSLPPGTLGNLVTHLQQFKRLPLGVQANLHKEIQELEDLLPIDPSLALARALDNFHAVKAEYEFIPGRSQK